MFCSLWTWLFLGALSPENAEDMEIHAYPDGDLARHFWDTKSTSGSWIELAGRAGRQWPLAWSSKAQPASAAHTQEAEMVSLSMAIRNEAAPLQVLFAALLGRPVPVVVWEANEAAITAAKKATASDTTKA